MRWDGGADERNIFGTFKTAFDGNVTVCNTGDGHRQNP